ncbi:unnamed protein product [Dicrocoelium dendriticum]|nr:unnamed protein product [Dicrocoelium dendriticum]
MPRYPPDRWTDYCPFGVPLKGTRLLPVKLPISTVQFCYHFHQRISCVIDLTYAAYYDPKLGVRYHKIYVEGHQVPHINHVKEFSRVIDEERSKSPDSGRANNGCCESRRFPVFISVFTGIRGMASLPVESMRTGGLYWFTDLTIPDPYYLLPLISMTTTLIVLETGAEMSTQHVSPLLKLFLRLSPCIGFLFVMNMPSGMLWYWTISNLISLIQSFVLRVPVVRNWLQLPAPKKPLKTIKSSRGFFEGVKESLTNVRLLSELETRERLDAKKWQQAGRLAAPRTFAHDPRITSAPRVTGTLTNSCSEHPTNQRAQGSG